MSHFFKGDPSLHTQARHPEWVSNDLKSYLDGELSLLHRRRIRKHLSRCWTCQGELEELKQLVKEVKSVDGATPRPELRERILAGLPELPPAHFSPPRRYTLPPLSSSAMRFALGSAAIAASLVGAFALGRVTKDVHTVERPLTPFVTSLGQIQSDGKLFPSTSERPDPKLSGRNPVKSSSSAYAVRTTDPFSTHKSPGDGYNDPISAKAEQLFQAELKAEGKRKKQEQELARSLPATNPQAQYGSGRLEDPIRLSLPVSEIASISDRLQTAIQSLGITVTPLVGMGEASRSFQEMSADHSIAQNATASVSVPGHLMLIRVPASRVPDFMRLLTNNTAAASGAGDVAKPTSVSEADKAGFGPGRGSHLTAPNHYPTLAERESWIHSIPEYKERLLSQKDSFLTYLVWLHPVK